MSVAVDRRAAAAAAAPGAAACAAGSAHGMKRLRRDSRWRRGGAEKVESLGTTVDSRPRCCAYFWRVDIAECWSLVFAVALNIGQKVVKRAVVIRAKYLFV